MQYHYSDFAIYTGNVKCKLNKNQASWYADANIYYEEQLKQAEQCFAN